MRKQRFPRMRRLERRRVNRLVGEGFAWKTAREYASQGIPITRVYMRKMRSLMRRGRLDESDYPDAWSMFRAFYRRSVALGDYVPPLRPYDPSKPHRKMGARGQIDREHVSRMAAKARERAKERKPPPTGDRREWIRQLQERAERATSPAQRRQFQSQIERLEAGL